MLLTKGEKRRKIVAMHHKIKKTMNCPKCKTEMSKLSKYCPSCGQYVGNGARSPNEMRAHIVAIKRHVPEIGDPQTAMWYLTFMKGALAALAWSAGEMDKSPMDIATMRLKTGHE